MNVSPPNIQKVKTGTCPHGLPLGACPICNGMGGGGGSASAKKTDPHAGEMTWNECYAVWQQMIKAKELAQQRKNENIQAQMISQYKMQLSISNFSQKILNLAEKLTNFVQKTSADSSMLSKTLAFAAKLVIPALNTLKNVLIATEKTINLVKEKLADISDKLNAIFGELKNSIEKKISDRLKDFKKKFKSLFGIYEPDDIDEEDKRLEESKKMFELKTVLTKLKEKIFKNKELTDDISC